MRVADLLWLPRVVDKLLLKHGVTPQEVIEILIGSAYYRKLHRGHIQGEDVYSAMGQTEDGRYLIVFFIYKITGEALILSARDMDDKERRTYERR